ncbi:MAG: ParB/RepB/Spo0J family partition protein [Armatimonadetes bacterium]|nr:ParB/RepB/Spo0J family partition protein [Armatimonadota bacterium]
MDLVDIAKIGPAVDQPRKTFDQGALLELAMSIRERGVLEPIIVRPIKGQDKYEIVMGERRWRASQLAGLTQIPAIIRELSDDDAATDAVIENFQREDLNPVERARAVKKLLEFMPWENCLKTLGVADSTMRRYLDLLDLPEAILTEIVTKPVDGEGEFLEGHGMALRALNGNFKVQIRLAKKVRIEKLSVEDLKKIVAAIIEVPSKVEAFLQVPLHVTMEILRGLQRQAEKKKPYQPKSAQSHLKSVQKACTGVLDVLDERLANYLSVSEMNQLLSATADIAEQITKFNRVMRDSLQQTDITFKEIYIHCPLCGRIELIGSLRCSVCWTILRRCLDCENYDHSYQKCSKSGCAIYMSDAESPEEPSPSYKCVDYLPKFDIQAAA